MRWWSASTIGPLLVALAASVVAAAPPAGEVTGVVKDAFERPLPAARVRLETGDGRVTDRVTADDQGRFTFTGVAPGRCRSLTGRGSSRLLRNAIRSERASRFLAARQALSGFAAALPLFK